MLNKTIFLSMLLLVIVIHPIKCQVPSYLTGHEKEYNNNPRETNINWFKKAKFGMFIHYGLYSLLGKGEWIQYADTIPINEYAKLQNQFTASNFNADSIVKLAKKAGMKYITFTTKHHDGFCLFKTKATTFNSVNSLASRDLTQELVDACEREGLGLFLYYSYAVDWKHPWAMSREDGWYAARPAYKIKPKEYKYKKTPDSRKYIDFVHMQLKELLTQYPSVAGIWFDPITAYYENPEAFPIEETYSLIRKLSPHALISFKHGANGDEDFMAPERKRNSKVSELSQRYPIAHKAIEKNKINLKKYVTQCSLIYGDMIKQEMDTI